MYTQDDLDMDNAIATLSKMVFVQDLAKYKLTKERAISVITNSKNVSFKEAEIIYYNKAYLYHNANRRYKKSKKALINYISL